MAKNKKSSLGRGLDSLIPTNFYDENFDSNSSLSLEDMLENKSEEDVTEDNSEKSLGEVKNEDSKVIKEDSEEFGDESNFDEEEINDDEDIVIKKDSDLLEEETSNSKEIIDESKSDDDILTEDLEDNSIVITPEIQEYIQEVEEIVKKNPRITLWSVQSASVFRYLRKTKPEFSISKEASSLIDEAVSKKYPEIWKLFDEN